MVTIDQVTVTVTVEGSGDPHEATFLRLFNRAIDRWWREMQSRAGRDARLAADRAIKPAQRDATR
jgi:hypothetical protein